MMTPRDWTLLAVALSPRRSLRPVQLQKALFLLGGNPSRTQLQTTSFYELEPYDYRPLYV